MFVPNFKILGAVVSEKSLPKTFIRGKEKWMHTGNDKHDDADCVLHNTTSHIANVCTKFQNLRCSSSWETFNTNFPVHYIGMRDGKKKKKSKKKAK